MFFDMILRAEPIYFKSKNLFELWTIASPEFFQAHFFPYDSIEVIEFSLPSLPKFILYGLKNCEIWSENYNLTLLVHKIDSYSSSIHARYSYARLYVIAKERI